MYKFPFKKLYFKEIKRNKMKETWAFITATLHNKHFSEKKLLLSMDFQ